MRLVLRNFIKDVELLGLDGGARESLAMAHKQILFHSAAREKILRGTAALADAVLSENHIRTYW